MTSISSGGVPPWLRAQLLQEAQANAARRHDALKQQALVEADRNLREPGKPGREPGAITHSPPLPSEGALLNEELGKVPPATPPPPPPHGIQSLIAGASLGALLAAQEQRGRTPDIPQTNEDKSIRRT